MAKRNKAQRDLKKSERMTPYDAKIGDSFARKAENEKPPPRALTQAEVRANNTAMVELGNLVGDLFRWAPMFRADLEAMNRGKRGRPFEYSDLLVFWVTYVMAVFDGTFRLTAGFADSILNLVGLSGPSYSRLMERGTVLFEGYAVEEEDPVRRAYGDGILAVRVDPEPRSRVRRVGIDSTGINLSDTTLWRSVKWRTGPKQKGWLHLHSLCDVDTGEMIASAVTDGSVGDAPLLKLLVSAAADRGHSFDTVYADGAYSSNENWIYLCRENGYRFVTSFKVNTTPTSNGCVARGEAAKLWCSLPYSEWTKVSGYGTRWKCECTFSDFKRIFPETVTARCRRGIVRQMIIRIGVFNDYKSKRAGIMKVTGNGVAVA